MHLYLAIILFRYCKITAAEKVAITNIGMTMSKEQSDPLYILLLSIHGLIRGIEIELGRDADTGGQVKYVV